MKNFPKGICERCAREQQNHSPLSQQGIYYCPHHRVLSQGDCNGGWTIKIGVTPDKYSKQMAAAQ
ncbi:MAG: hypothetical protein HQL79_11410 [Magnetococcales bacterium]|nr:hypothetical protein [Magnetococcales bacterium]